MNKIGGKNKILPLQQDDEWYNAYLFKIFENFLSHRNHAVIWEYFLIGIANLICSNRFITLTFFFNSKLLTGTEFKL